VRVDQASRNRWLRSHHGDSSHAASIRWLSMSSELPGRSVEGMVDRIEIDGAAAMTTHAL
jgi:hypothetical protein